MILHPTTLIRRSGLERVGLFDGTVRFAADMEFVGRAHQKKLRIRNLREPLYDYRRRPGALTMSEATGHGSAARESYIERVFAPGRRNARSPVESDIEFELFPVQPTTRRN